MDLVVGRRADILHGGAFGVDLQGGPMDQHVFGQVDVGAAVAVGLDADREVARPAARSIRFRSIRSSPALIVPRRCVIGCVSPAFSGMSVSTTFSAAPLPLLPSFSL